MPAEQGIRGFRSLMNLPDRRAEDGPVGAARRYGANTVVEGLGVIVAMPQRDLDHDIEQCTALHGTVSLRARSTLVEVWRSRVAVALILFATQSCQAIRQAR